MSAIEDEKEQQENNNKENVIPLEPEAQPQQETDFIKIPRDQFTQLSQANRTAVIITAQLVDKFDEILDKCAEFESYVRQKKLEAKEMFNAATRPSSQSPSQ